MLTKVSQARCFCARLRAPTEAGEPVSTRFCLNNLQTDERKAAQKQAEGELSQHIWKTKQLRG